MTDLSEGIDVRFISERLGHTETVCDNCCESILASEDRFDNNGSIECDGCWNDPEFYHGHIPSNGIDHDAYPNVRLLWHGSSGC